MVGIYIDIVSAAKSANYNLEITICDLQRKGKDVIRVIEAAYESSRTGEVVRLD
jgi:hypothetical protein